MRVHPNLRTLLKLLTIVMVIILPATMVASAQGDDAADSEASTDKPANDAANGEASAEESTDDAAFRQKMQAWLDDYQKAYGKVKDPYHPRFDPDQFQFEDYSGTCMMMEVTAKLFPRGTPKEFVDRVLVKAGGARAKKVPEHVGPNLYSYFIKLNPGPLVFMSHEWNISVHYDRSDEVFDVRFPIGRPPGESAYDFFEYCKHGKHYGENWGIE